MTRTINDAGLALLKDFEQGPGGGPARLPYDAGDGKQTVGWGHVVVGGDILTYPISEEVANTLLLEDLIWAGTAVETVTVSLSDNQFSALVCLCYNIGAGNFKASTLLRVLNNGFYNRVPEQMIRWNHVGGVVSTGLTRRRAAEIALWNA
jgi:lysozyme